MADNSVVKTITSADGLRKIEVFERSDGSFGFEGYRYSCEPTERCWIPYGFFASRFDSPLTAESEALERVSWSKLLDGMTINERLYELDLHREFDDARADKDAEKIKEILLRARVDLPSIKAIIDGLKIGCFWPRGARCLLVSRLTASSRSSRCKKADAGQTFEQR